ncbi:MAG: major facilitator superfamily protein [Lacrimispora sp.]|jgi:MFS family permease|nr:major facilitator superfamily protein [Lacrimispora sp.]
MKTKLNTDYIIFWLGQAVSQLGSSMTSFALTIWAYQQTKSAMAVSLMTFCSYLPYILVSIFAGAFIDRTSKKMILIISDTIAAVCTISVLINLSQGNLVLTQIYIVNAVVGFMNAFQSPAAAVVTGQLITDGNYEKASGLNSFSSNLIMVTAPVLSGALVGFCGIRMVLTVDLLTFVFCMFTLVYVKLGKNPETSKAHKSRQKRNDREGIEFLKKELGILYLMISLALINFFSRLTYENILTPMILARSGGDAGTLGLVNSMLGAGGIAGGIIVAAGKRKKNPCKMIYLSAVISFMFGDLLMGAGRNIFAWSAAGIFASLPIPFLMAGQNTLLYRMVPEHIQGRIFAIRNGIQFSTIPIGLLLGGYLADSVFEPFMSSEHAAAIFLQGIVGKGTGSGMAVMFLCTGILGALSSVLGYKNSVKNLTRSA